jgi:hypothetical protein
VLYDVTGSWSLALFAPCIFFFLTGSAAYVLYGSADRQVCGFAGAKPAPPRHSTGSPPQAFLSGSCPWEKDALGLFRLTQKQVEETVAVQPRGTPAISHI